MANPEEHRPLDLSEEDRQQYGCDVAFIGWFGPVRTEALRRLTDYDLRIWGLHWDKTPDLAPFVSSEPVYGLKKTKIYNAARIVLNIEDDEKQINAISQRIPEVLACGGFILTDWHKDLEVTPLVEGESIVCYRSLDELKEKVDYYLNHPEERKAISEKGRKIVLESMLYRKVAEKIAGEIEQVLSQKRG
jgi:spore maturation protein CgeB